MKLKKPLRIISHFPITGLKNRLNLIRIALFGKGLIITGDTIQIAESVVKRVLRNRRRRRVRV